MKIFRTGWLVACIALAGAPPAARPSSSDADRLAVFQTLVTLAGRVLQTEQMVIATKDVCEQPREPDPRLSPGYARWLQSGGAKFAKAHRILLDRALVQRLLGERLASDPAAAAIVRSLPQMAINEYQRGRAAARTTDCAEFARRLGDGQFDYARQTPPAFRIIDRFDPGKAEQYTPATLLALGK